MRCPRCGNENPDQNRFCGMCGATLLAASEAAQPQRVATPVSASAAQAAAPRPQASEPPRPAPPAPSSAPPSISGPSFLGLNDPAPRKRASLSIDPHSAPPSRNLDYLLEDDAEEHKSSGAGKVFLILIALALAVGLGYLRWKNHGFGWLGTTNKPSAAATPTASDTNPATPTTDSQSPAIQPAPSTPTPSVAPPASSSASTPAPGNAAPAGTPSTAPPAAGASTDTDKPADVTTSAAPDTPAQPAAKPSTPAPKQPPDGSAAPPDTSDEPKPAAELPQPKPRPAVKPAAPVDPVAEAQKYLYGRGVPQDCERGMRLLKPIANQSNPKAMIEMGALYSAGLCTPHDLPTAYRWFALALRKDPNNDAVQADLQKLWGEMTQPERQLAIKLTQ